MLRRNYRALRVNRGTGAAKKMRPPAMLQQSTTSFANCASLQVVNAISLLAEERSQGFTRARAQNGERLSSGIIQRSESEQCSVSYSCSMLPTDAQSLVTYHGTQTAPSM
jgi:hypothetical protein